MADIDHKKICDDKKVKEGKANIKRKYRPLRCANGYIQEVIIMISFFSLLEFICQF